VEKARKKKNTTVAQSKRTTLLSEEANEGMAKRRAIRLFAANSLSVRADYRIELKGDCPCWPDLSN